MEYDQDKENFFILRATVLETGRVRGWYEPKAREKFKEVCVCVTTPICVCVCV